MKDRFGSARPYSAAFMILRKGNKAAFVLRANTSWMDGFYGLPAGKVEIAEQFSLAAIREAKEEVGVTVNPKDVQHQITVHRYSGKEDDGHVMEWVDVYFEAAAWDGEPFNAEPEVSTELAWLDLDNLPENVVPSQRAALESIKVGKSYDEFNWD